MSLDRKTQGPWALPGQVFATVLGTAVSFSAGAALAFTGLALQNPPGSGAKVTILRANMLSTTNGDTPWGIMKVTGTAAAGTLSAYSGVITSPGLTGTATGGGVSLAKIGTNVGTSVVILTGTFTVLNGTLAPSPNGLNWVEVLGITGTNATFGAMQDVDGDVTVMPGETIAVSANTAVSALACLVWQEGSL